jgi:hypothetical protein
MTTSVFTEEVTHLEERTYTYTGAIQRDKTADGYKVFEADWKCRGFQYKLGEVFEMHSSRVALCASGFHYCKHPINCLSYYSFHGRKFARIQNLGEAIDAIAEALPKTVTNLIKIEEEISESDWLELCTVTII